MRREQNSNPIFHERLYQKNIKSDADKMQLVCVKRKRARSGTKERAHGVQLNSIFASRVHYHCTEVNLNFANRETCTLSHDALSISSIYARLSRHIRSTGRYHNALRATVRRDFLFQA